MIVDRELDAFDLREVLQSVLRLLAAPTTRFVTTEGRSIVELVPTIDPHRTSLEPLSNPNRLADITAADASRKTINCVVCAFNCFVDGLELHALHHGAEDLFLGDCHVIAHVAPC